MFKKLQQWEEKYSNFAYAYAIIGNLSIAMMQFCMKIVSQTIGSFYAIYFRGFCLFFINTIMLHIYSIPVDQKNPSTFKTLIKRTAFSSLTIIFYLGPIAYIPMGIINSLFNLGPIVIYFLEAWEYQKPISRVHFILTVICFCGVLLIVKPGFLFSDSSEHTYSMLIIFPFLAAFTNSMAMILLHSLKGKVSSLIPLHYFYIAQTLQTAVLQTIIPQQSHYEMINSHFYIAAIGSVLFAYLAQNCITKAMFLKKASYILPFGYLTIILSFTFDLIIFHEYFDIWSLLGIFLASSGLMAKLFIKQ